MYRLIFGLLFLPYLGMAQTRLYVMQVHGAITVKDNGLLRKGDRLIPGSFIHVPAQSSITLLDDSGNTYAFTKSGTFTFDDVLRTKRKHKNNITLNYLKYLWESFISESSPKNLKAGVYRGDHLMLSPVDSAEVLCSEVMLKWKSEEGLTDYHIFVKQTDSEEFSRFTTQDTTWNLTCQFSLLENTDYQWAISTHAYPNLKNIPFFTFHTIDSLSFKAREKQFKRFVKDMKGAGLKEEEINEIIRNYQEKIFFRK